MLLRQIKLDNDYSYPFQQDMTSPSFCCCCYPWVFVFLHENKSSHTINNAGHINFKYQINNIQNDAQKKVMPNC